MTNGDRVRKMTDEEIAERFGFEECKDSKHGYECPAWAEANCGGAKCRDMFLLWLKQEVRE